MASPANPVIPTTADATAAGAAVNNTANGTANGVTNGTNGTNGHTVTGEKSTKKASIIRRLVNKFKAKMKNRKKKESAIISSDRPSTTTQEQAPTRKQPYHAQPLPQDVV